jgi:hypothetical protein
MRFVELVVLGSVLLVLSALGVKGIQLADDAEDVILCKNNIRTLSQGVSDYETAKGYLPPFKVVGGYPGWNLRILPYMGYANVHNVLVENNRYTLSAVSASVTDPRTFWEKNIDELADWTACNEAIATVMQFRDPSRQSEAIVKEEFDSENLTQENYDFYGVPTDYATPVIWTDFNNRYVTLTWSIFKLESPFEIYEVNRKQNQYWNTRHSDNWRDGKTNTMIIGEKYIPDWAVSGNDIESKLFNGGLQSLRQVPQMAAQCIDVATNPIVQDNESPITQDSNDLHTRYWYGMLHRNKPDNNEAWRGNYAWGSNHAGVIVAAMGDGSVRSINKTMNAGTFYNLCASNVLPEPTDQEKALADEEFRVVELREKYATEEAEITELQNALKLIQAQLKSEQTKQTQLNTQIQTLTTQIIAINLAPNETTQAALAALQEQLAEAQEALTLCEALIESYNAAVIQLQNQIAGLQAALLQTKITNGDAVAPNNVTNNE